MEQIKSLGTKLNSSLEERFKSTPRDQLQEISKQVASEMPFMEKSEKLDTLRSRVQASKHGIIHFPYTNTLRKKLSLPLGAEPTQT